MAFAVAALALGACNKQQQPAQDQNIAIDSDVPNNEVGNADIETLPPDESSVTPSNQLENGFDNPDVNDAENTNANSY